MPGPDSRWRLHTAAERFLRDASLARTHSCRDHSFEQSLCFHTSRLKSQVDTTSRAPVPATSSVPPPKPSAVLSEQALADERVERASDLQVKCYPGSSQVTLGTS